MTQERRSTDQEILSKLDDIKDDLKEHKQDIKELIDEKFTIHNQIYFNGFEPHRHVADHHVISGIVEDMQDNKKNSHKMVWAWIDRGLWAAITFVAASTWYSFKDNVNDVQPTKPKTEQAQNADTPRHP